MTIVLNQIICLYVNIKSWRIHDITFIWQTLLSNAYSKCIPKVIGTTSKHRSEKVQCSLCSSNA
uniref:Uncharacterized protein n=1 Tax=Anguilla anguilla TaxID=7936 RepID=A0A0E9XBU6_ANGAN